MEFKKNRLKGIELYCSDFRDLNLIVDPENWTTR